MRRAARIDRNQPEIVQAFRLCGYSVLPLHMIGKGCPDILVGKNGLNYLVEIKDAQQPPSKRKLTADEQDFHAEWRGQVTIIETVDQVLNFGGDHGMGTLD